MKFSLILCVVAIIAVSSVSAIVNNKSVAFKMARQCAKQHGIEMHQVKQYMRGEIDSKSKNSKVSIEHLKLIIKSN